VVNTVRDARRLGYAVYVLGDAIRAVDVHAGDGAAAEKEIRSVGATVITFDAIAGVNRAAGARADPAPAPRDR
jgi:nicotinamidase/pyrazinamidase